MIRILYSEHVAILNPTFPTPAYPTDGEATFFCYSFQTPREVAEVELHLSSSVSGTRLPLRDHEKHINRS